MKIASVKKAFKGEHHCGDECGWWQEKGKTTLCVADGLGHGERAEMAATAAIAFVSHHLDDSLAEIFTDCNQKLRDTRGVAMGIAVIDEKAGTMTYGGIGNIRAILARGLEVETDTRKIVRLASNPGIVGGGFRKLNTETLELEMNDLVLIFTDGIEIYDPSNSLIDLARDIQSLAERIIRQDSYDTDDAAILIYKWQGSINDTR